jgi:hypothetical protein
MNKILEEDGWRCQCGTWNSIENKRCEECGALEDEISDNKSLELEKGKLSTTKRIVPY